ncbi:LON peptidase substrate-binding domain-containing protein [Sulfitobacter sp. F26169L]|uniref:LON peptidase substrate-binding domain-containing protein n=1 Tax=Sulfitobacter sp. F26169L TaxID=2996015 RepID=UPI002260F961|nr:LON peptidase substrate-binding domain-containing protein [Sulfitobacter sp. F26169L]MCX7565657.1 LON peptidase substrate-binding domain-containing protein [Sulfitobacter sp. F26169L]
MIKQVDLPDTIPIFPLGGALLLPRSRLPLHIFEPRFLQMIEDALKTSNRLIGMIQPNIVPGREGTGLHTIGCAGRISQFSETEDGRYMITLAGVSRYRIVNEVEGFTPYRRCKVSWEGFEQDLRSEETDLGFKRKAFLDALGRYFDVRGLSADWETLKEADDELLINSLSMMLDFDAEDKQALLEAPSLSTRRETLVTLIEYALRGGNEGEMMQ